MPVILAEHKQRSAGPRDVWQEIQRDYIVTNGKRAEGQISRDETFPVIWARVRGLARLAVIEAARNLRGEDD